MGRFFKLLLFLLICISDIIAEEPPLYISPLDIQFNYSGSFGEIRLNHFHSGIDFGTKGGTGHPVRAIADGYVSRIKIEPGGYGKAIYIDHPAGTTSVYAHLQKFTTQIDSFIRNEQLRLKSFTIDWFPPQKLFNVKKGEIIAFSGNSGSSVAPHLHFEIRDYLTQDPIDPTYLIPGIKDTIPPDIKALYLYNCDSIQYGIFKHRVFPIVNKKNALQLIEDTLYIESKAAFGLEVVDYLSSKGSSGGIRTIDVFLDGVLFFKHQLDRFSYLLNRNVNAHIDYATFLKNKKEIVLQFQLPNNQLPIYVSNSNGFLELNDTLVHTIKYRVEDYSKNISTFSFLVRMRKISKPEFPELIETTPGFVAWNKQFVFANEYFKINIPESTLFHNIIFKSEVINHQSDILVSQLISLNPGHIGLNKSFQLGIVPNAKVEKKLYRKMVVVYYESDQKPIYSMGGIPDNDMIQTRLKNFGTYALALDTIAPVVKLKGSISSILKTGMIKLIVFDHLSGIGKINGFVDDQWVVFDYDAKNNLIVHQLEPKRNSQVSGHTLKLEVEDIKVNSTLFNLNFNW